FTAGRSERPGCRLCTRRRFFGQDAPSTTVSAVQRPFHRAESRADKNGAGLARRDVIRSSSSAGCHDAVESRTFTETARSISTQPGSRFPFAGREGGVNGYCVAEISLRILLIGSRGRMGRAIAGVAERDPNVEISAEVDQGESIEA